jgi:hypothetical protein
MGRPSKSNSGDLWEWQAPVALLAIGLVVILVEAFLAGGSEGATGSVLGIIIGLVVEVPITIVAMYVVAGFLSISFGILKTAILKLAVMIVFTAAIMLAGRALGLTGLAWLLALGVYFFLFSNFFDLDARETLLSVFLISVIRFVIGLFLGAILGGLLV